MSKHTLTFLLSAAVISGASANEKIPDTEEFEKQYIQCIESGFKSDCFSKTFSGHFDSYYKNPEKAPSSTVEYFQKWLNGKSVYKVHVASKVLKAGIFDNRSYLIERSDGAISGIFIGLRKVTGDWYVYDIQGGVTDSYVRGILNMPKTSSLDRQ